MYVRVPAIDGVPQVGKARLVSGVSISATEAIVEVYGKPEIIIAELTQVEFEAILPPVAADPAKPTDMQTLLARIEALETKLNAMHNDIKTVKADIGTIKPDTQPI